MTKVITAGKGVIIVDLGHNDKFSGEASYPWNTLTASLTYREVQACNLGISVSGRPLRKKMYLLISNHCELPDLHTCECASQGKSHDYTLSRRNQACDLNRRNKMIQARKALLFAINHQQSRGLDAEAVKQLLSETQGMMSTRYRKFLTDKFNEAKNSRDEIKPEKDEVENYPTEARIRQKAKEKQHKLLTGEKPKPKKRARDIKPGYDDCGEDTTSLNCPEDIAECHYQNSEARQRMSTEMKSSLPPEVEIFLMQDEGDLNPAQFFWGSHVN